MARLSIVCLVCYLPYILSLASCFYVSEWKFASQNLRNALQIVKCEALIRTLYFYHLQKR